MLFRAGLSKSTEIVAELASKTRNAHENLLALAQCLQRLVFFTLTSIACLCPHILQVLARQRAFPAVVIPDTNCFIHHLDQARARHIRLVSTSS